MTVESCTKQGLGPPLEPCVVAPSCIGPPRERDNARFGAGGPHLFGAFTNADAMFAPVATRFRTYAVDVAAFGDDGTASAYADAILAMPAIAAWTDGAEAELRGRKAEARG